MKIYLFCPETGVYQGEDFSDEPPVKKGDELLPSGATTVAPPAYGPGETPFFDATRQAWGLKRTGIGADLSITGEQL
jgi:hypothetical protein